VVIPELETGTTFAGYTIDGVAGAGGMGVVYRATEIALQRPVALKLIAADFAGDRKFRERFKRESMLAAAIDHPNVIPVYEAGEVEGELFIAMRFVDGIDLGVAVVRAGKLEPARAIRIIAQVGAALDAAHRRGLVHRDVKPGNVLLTGEGEEEHAYLTDFGLVKSLGAEGAGETTAGHFMGTVEFASPEQVNTGNTDARSDVYSLACVLFYALTGMSPFHRDSNVGTMFAHINEPAPSLVEYAPELPPALDAALQKALEKDPDARQQTTGELAREAQAALGGTAPSTPGSGSRLPRRTGTGQLAGKSAAAHAAGGAPQRARVLGFVLPGVLVLGLIVAGLAAAGVFSGGGEEGGKAAQSTPAATQAATNEPEPTAQPSQPAVTASIKVGKGPDGISVADDGTVWVSDSKDGTLARIDPKTNKLDGTPVEVGKQPDGIAGAKKVTWVAASGDDLVRRVESNPDPVVVASIPVGKAPEGISLGKQLVWVTNSGDGTVNRIDRASATLVGSPIGVGKNPIGVNVGADHVWIANHDDATVSRIDSATAEVDGSPIKVGKGPRGVVEGLGSVWVANSDDGTVTRIDPKTAKVIGEPIRVGKDPRELTTGGGFVWVANAGDNSVSQIDPKSGRVVGRAISVGDDPIGIAFGAGAIWTANFQDGTVTRIKVAS